MERQPVDRPTCVRMSEIWDATTPWSNSLSKKKQVLWPAYVNIVNALLLKCCKNNSLSSTSLFLLFLNILYYWISCSPASLASETHCPHTVKQHISKDEMKRSLKKACGQPISCCSEAREAGWGFSMPWVVYEYAHGIFGHGYQPSVGMQWLSD